MITITSANYANAENTAAVLMTQERGAVLVSQKDRPQLWQDLHAWITGGGAVQAYIAPVKPTPAEDAASGIMATPAFRGLIKVLANRFGITPQQLIDAVKAQANGV